MEWAAERHGLEYELKGIVGVSADETNDACIEIVAEVAVEVRCDTVRLRSSAGHDANYPNDTAPIGMILVPSVNGSRYHENEYTEREDVVAGAELLARIVGRRMLV
ncbi:M20/M25/M40 family metallo-hydrolase [Natronococcus sp. A-GB7]|uniref:M20/M25/M40 family metallo-hydrolase n=1 Tax=Natronococcus sp. A-GB7 TaxID=3037649 RepID=UPI00241E335F|nr:M20/M25/M40 family metallo-hydrolase [Natronococcus sp. A-GB7]MDG5821403.1 M20/M25/M40 family metallo-hydrolase [Natronococcus sp. A-GB7]